MSTGILCRAVGALGAIGRSRVRSVRAEPGASTVRRNFRAPPRRCASHPGYGEQIDSGDVCRRVHPGRRLLRQRRKCDDRSAPRDAVSSSDHRRPSHDPERSRPQPGPAQAHRRAGAGRRARQPAEEPHRPARQAGGVLRRQVPDHRLRAVQLPELRHPPHRRHHAVQEPQPDAPPAARLGLPEERDERVRRPDARAAACRRGELVPRHGRCRVPEPGHPGQLRRRLHRRAGRRPHLQDELRADAGRPRGQGARLHGGLHRGAAHGGDGLRRDGASTRSTT